MLLINRVCKIVYKGYIFLLSLKRLFLGMVDSVEVVLTIVAANMKDNVFSYGYSLPCTGTQSCRFDVFFSEMPLCHKGVAYLICFFIFLNTRLCRKSLRPFHSVVKKQSSTLFLDWKLFQNIFHFSGKAIE